MEESLSLRCITLHFELKEGNADDQGSGCHDESTTTYLFFSKVSVLSLLLLLYYE